ncbi:Tetratricopeptide-like helical domain, partial [Trinorchestia longiramus]
ELFSFDDTLFSEEKKETSCNVQFEAHHQDPCWFLSVDINNPPSYIDKLALLKHKADYFYLKNNYQSAISFYEQMLALLPDNNVVTRRECYENLAWCYSKDKMHCKSLLFSHLLHLTSRTVEHLTVSLTCIMDMHASCSAYPGALLACIKLISVHKLNSHLWLRLAFILSRILEVEASGLATLVKIQHDVDQHCCDEDFCAAGIPGSFFSGWEGRNKNILVLFCLMMSKYIMTGVRGTSIGFTAAILRNNIDKIDEEITRLDKSSVLCDTLISQLDCIVTKNVFGYDRNQSNGSEEKSDFVDRGSSKFKGEIIDVSFRSVSSYTFDDFHHEWFDDIL